MTCTARNRTSMPGLNTSRRCWNATMAIWIWPLQRTMRERGLWIVLTACPRSGKPGITCNGCRVLISGRARDVWMARSSILAQSAKQPIRTAVLFLQTTERLRTTGQLKKHQRSERWGGGLCMKFSRKTVACDFSAFKAQRLRVFGHFFSSFFFHRSFARASPVFAVALLAASNVGLVPSLAASSSSADPAAAAKRQSASTQFLRAQDQRTALNNKSTEKRTLEDYKQVVNTFRRVYMITPHAAEVPDALLAVAELYTEMGERFGRSYFQSAVDTFQFSILEYPHSLYFQEDSLV